MKFPDCTERAPLYDIYLSSKNMKELTKNQESKQEEYYIWCNRERILKGAIYALGWNDRLDEYEQAYDEVLRLLKEDLSKRFYLEDWNKYYKGV